MVKKITLIFAALVFLISSSEAANQDQINLKWNFSEGQSFVMQGVLEFDAAADIPKQMLLPPVQSSNSVVPKVDGVEKALGQIDLQFLWQVKVLSVDSAGNADLEMVLEQAVVKANAKLGEQQFNYEADLFEPMISPDGSQALLNPQDMTNIWKVAPNGKLVAINGQNVDQTIAQLQQELFNSGVDVNADEMRRLTDMFFYFMAIYPSKPVSVGEKWVRKVDLSNLLKSGSSHEGVMVNNFHLLFQQNWLLKNRGSQEIVLEGKSDAMPKFQMSLDGPEANVNFSASGVESSQIKVDEASGMVTNSNQHVIITGELDAQEKTGAAQQFNIPFELNLKSNFSLSQ